MVTWTGNVAEGQATPIQGFCKSGDTKPTNWNGVTNSGSTAALPNGSFLLEMDTGTSYFYDQATETWLAQ